MKELGLSLLYVSGVLIAGYVAGKFVIPLGWPFVVAIVLAWMIDSPVGYLERTLKVQRGVAVGVVLIAVTLLLSGLVSLGVSRLLVEVSELVKQLPALQDKVLDLIDGLTAAVGRYAKEMPTGMEMFYRAQVNRISGWAELILGELLNRVALVPGFVAGLIVSVVATFFLSRDKEAIRQGLLQVVPKPIRYRVSETQAELVRTIIRIVVAQVKLVTMTTLITIVGFELIGSKYAVVLGLVSGLLDILPIVGPAVLFIPWAIVCFVNGDPLRGLALLGLYGGICLWRQAAQARLVGESIGVHPLTTLFSLYVGMRLLGLLGLLIGPLVVLILKVMAEKGAFPIIKDGKA